MQNTIKNLRIGLLATGNELTEGDILNTNGQLMARQLADTGITLGMHVIVSDQEEDIAEGLKFLLQHHTVIIISGGLGPTSDDRTRYALSKVLNKPLLFDEPTWENIIKRFQRLGLAAQPHPSNKQQALFPEEATIIPNPNGSAAGCHVIHDGKTIYMLPGPPNECLTMFKDVVLPALSAQQTTTLKKLKWRLLGVMESDIAAKVEEAFKEYPIITGYRIDYPYLEIKIYTEQAAIIDTIENKIQALFSDQLVGSIDKTASELLKEAIVACPYPIIIDDHATHGQLQAQLVNPATYKKLRFAAIDAANNSSAITILINGLTEFWQGQLPTGQTTLELVISYQTLQEQIKLNIPFRNPLVVKYAIEYIARETLSFLKKTL